jgi:hypothetical protein
VGFLFNKSRFLVSFKPLEAKHFKDKHRQGDTMKPQFDLTAKYFNTRYAPLCVVGYVLREQATLDSLLNFDVISQKKRDHTPGEKLMDAFLLIMAGYPSLYLLNQHLRPDLVLAQAWGRQRLAEQSNISRLLDSFDEIALAQLRTISWHFRSAHSRLPSHDWRKKLVVDLDLTPLWASPRAQASTKGYLGKKMSQVAS